MWCARIFKKQYISLKHHTEYLIYVYILAERRLMSTSWCTSALLYIYIKLSMRYTCIYIIIETVGVIRVYIYYIQNSGYVTHVLILYIKQWLRYAYTYIILTKCIYIVIIQWMHYVHIYILPTKRITTNMWPSSHTPRV